METEYAAERAWEPSPELKAVMALSGDRTNAGTLPETLREGSVAAKAKLHDAKEHQQERAADFWQRTLDVGRQQRQSSKQMHEVEQEASKEPQRLKV